MFTQVAPQSWAHLKKFDAENLGKKTAVAPDPIAQNKHNACAFA